MIVDSVETRVTLSVVEVSRLYEIEIIIRMQLIDFLPYKTLSSFWLFSP